MTENYEYPEDSNKLNWDAYQPIAIAIKNQPVGANFEYLKKHRLLENETYIKWKKPYRTTEGQLVQINQPGDFVLRALILAKHLPWVIDTYPFTLEMGEVEPGQESFLGKEDNATNAVRFAYQEATMNRPIKEQTKVERYTNDLSKGLSKEDALRRLGKNPESWTDKVPNDELIAIWKINGKERVEWLIDVFMKEVRKEAKMLRSLKASSEGRPFEEDEETFIADIMEILAPIEQLIN